MKVKKKDKRTLLQISLINKPELIGIIDEIVQRTGVSNRKELFLKYHALFLWVLEREESGKRIIAIGDDGKEEELPWKMLIS